MKKLMIAPRTLVAMKWIILPLFMGLFSLPSFAKEGFRNYPQDRNNKYRVQGIPVRGSVKDESGTPLAGATVRVKGRDVQTMTNAKGEFSFADLDPTATLVVSYVGYNDLEIEVKNKSELTASLRAAEGSLNQVVVIGYGSAKKKELVSAVNVVNAKDAGANTATSATQLLQGKAAGVQVVQNTGQPGAGAQIIIRGTGSFTSVDPLYVIDGIQADLNLFNSLSTQDVESITILKDASATAIYGAAAANGVVMITTKKAKSGTPRITFNSQVGFSKPWRKLDLLNAKDYVDLTKEVANVTGTPLPTKFNTPGVLVDSTDWQDEIFRTAISTDNHITLSGGSDKVLYNFSAGYITQQSIIQNFQNKRFNVRFGLDELLGRFHFGESVTMRYTNSSGALAGLTDAMLYPPYKRILDPNIPGGYSIVSNVEDLSNAGNPVQRINLSERSVREFVLYPQVFGEVSVIDGLKFRSQLSAKLGGSKYTEFVQPFTGSNYLTFDRQALEGYSEYANYTFENYFSYNKRIGDHDISATIGNSYIHPGHYSSLNASGSNIPNDEIRNIAVALSQAVTGAVNDYANQSVISYFGRIMYGFKDKYLLSASLRRDGASVFGSANRFGNFPGLGAGWKFSEENFVKNAIPGLSNGKLRVGWGRTGNNNIPPFLTDALTFSGSPSGNLVYTFGNNETFYPGVTVNRIPNPNLKWESTDQTDIGLDLGFFKNKLNVTVDAYKRKNSDLLVNVPLPTSVGIGGTGYVGSSIITNAATAENKGVELTVGYTSKVNNDLTLNISGNAAYNKNEVLSLGKEFLAPIRAGAFSSVGAITYTATGFPIGSFYGFRVDHVAKDQAEIDALNAEAVKKTGNATAVFQTDLKPGDFIFRDLTGNGIVDDSDQQVLGNPMPKVVYGFNAGITYKNFDFNVVIAGVSGLKLINANRYFTHFADKPHNASTDILNRWKKPGDVAALPRAGQDAVSNLRASDFYMEDGSFLRLRNLTIGYRIPKSALQSVAGNVVSNLRLYVAAENLFTITKYKGYDPEVGTQGNSGDFIFSRGIDNGLYPQPRTFLFGVQVEF